MQEILRWLTFKLAQNLDHGPVVNPTNLLCANWPYILLGYLQYYLDQFLAQGLVSLYVRMLHYYLYTVLKNVLLL